jgi:hypothetical protein
VEYHNPVCFLGFVNHFQVDSPFIQQLIDVVTSQDEKPVFSSDDIECEHAIRSKSFAFTNACNQTRDSGQSCFYASCGTLKSFKKSLFTHLVNSNILGK